MKARGGESLCGPLAARAGRGRRGGAGADEGAGADAVVAMKSASDMTAAGSHSARPWVRAPWA